VAQDGISYAPALDPLRGMLTDPSCLIWRGYPDPTDFFYGIFLLIMIETIENAFGTHGQQDS
jgi:hypothetical protein